MDTICVNISISFVDQHRNGSVVSSVTGGGSGMVVGSIYFRNGGNTPTVDDYNGVERTCGTIRITTNLGNYLPDTDIRVIQLPGKEHKFTNGYVGSFHRNNQVGARNVSMTNTGAWSARIISGLDWIKIDGNLKTHGRAITIRMKEHHLQALIAIHTTEK